MRTLVDSGVRPACMAASPPSRIASGAAHRARWLVALGWIAAVGMIPLGLAAQDTTIAVPAPEPIRGQATTTEDVPLAQVDIELWGDNGRLQVVTTNADGRFQFAASLTSRASALYAQRLGYRAVRISTMPGTTYYALRMAPEPLTMEGLVVDVEADRCSAREDSDARALWQALRERYSHGIDSLGAATYLAAAITAVPLGEIGPVDIGDARTAQRGSAPLFRSSWRRRVLREGYARRLSAPSPDGMFESWGYPPLDADFATHFLDTTFGRLHKFHLLEEEEVEGWMLGFCPRDQDRASIAGFMRVTPDTTLVLAEWTFRTEAPEEGAGGRAVFTQGEGGIGGTYLLPTEGLFWRRVDANRYLQRYQRFEGWITAPGDSVPFLPARGAGS